MSHSKATLKPPTSHLLGSSEPPTSHPHATLKPPQSRLQADHKPGTWEKLSCVPRVLLVCFSCVALVLPSASHGDLGGMAGVPPRLCPILTALVWPRFKRNRILPFRAQRKDLVAVCRLPKHPCAMKRMLCSAALLLPVSALAGAVPGQAPAGDGVSRNDQKLADYFRARDRGALGALPGGHPFAGGLGGAARRVSAAVAGDARACGPCRSGRT